MLSSNPTRMDAATMREFRHLLLASPIPNGAIVRVRLSARDKVCISSVITSHLDEKKKPCRRLSSDPSVMYPILPGPCTLNIVDDIAGMLSKVEPGKHIGIRTYYTNPNHR